MEVDAILSPLGATDAAFARRYPGERPDRQPVHTVYGGAHRFRADFAPRLGEAALRFLEEYAPDAGSLAAALGLDAPPELADAVYDRIRRKLETEPVEDFRIDFEDGFGTRPDPEEDEAAAAAAREAARGMEEETLSPFLGIRIKPLGTSATGRGVRTLDLFLTTLHRETGGPLPPNFVVTLPKVVHPGQVAALAELLDRLESKLLLEPGGLRLEIMVETPQALLDGEGRVPLLAMAEAGAGRCVGAHFGVYDYTASLSIAPDLQGMRHPACDRARGIMQDALAGTGIRLSDGATNVLPVPLHRPGDGDLEPGDGRLGPEQMAENRASVHRGWRLHYEDVRHSLANGFYQGWDLHPAQLVTRYAAVYAFFLERLASASVRLRSFVEGAGRASLSRDVMDDAATGQALLDFFRRGLACGAITEEEALRTGLGPEELRTRSFPEILRLQA